MTHQAATLAQKAGSTRSRRAKAGKYPTASQKLAERKLINQGITVLTRDELETLSTHPFFTVSQRNNFAALAAALA